MSYKAPLGTFQEYSAEFVNKYAIYTEPAQLALIEYLFSKDITKPIAEHFGNITIEISDGCLYLYAWHQRPSLTLLTRMLQNGAWLAGALDERMRQQD